MNTKRLVTAFRLIKRVMNHRLVIMLLLLLSSAWPTGSAYADTSVCGPINTNTTWMPADNNFIVSCDVNVISGVRLTIQPGVVVKFNPGTTLLVNGELVAHGATFTSNNAVPAPGDWGHIHFSATSVDAAFDADGNYLSGSIIQDSLIEWGGGGAYFGGAIESIIASPLIVSNTIQNNLNSGIRAIGRSTGLPIRIRRNNIALNGAFNAKGGGVNVSAGEVVSNTITQNTVGYEGGGIFASTATTITGNLISGNSGSYGGGINATGSTVTGNTIDSNHANGSGGGIYATSSTLDANTVSGNTGSGCGGIQAVGNSTVDDNHVSGNNPGGICIEGGIATGNTVNGNTTTGQGGGFLATSATVSGNVVSNNNAVDGGGIYSTDSHLASNTITTNHASGKGGGIFAYSTTTATNNEVNGNTAAQGGGIYAVDYFGGLPNLAGNTIQNNGANSGAGIYAVNATLRGNTVTTNTAQSDGGGLYAEGGTLNNNTLSGNNVPTFGHGSGAYLKSVVDFSYNSVLSNTASGGTAGGISIDGQPQILHNNLYGNEPYDAEVVSTQEVSGTLNYWGSLACTGIPGRIYDGNDAPPRGHLLYAPSLYSPAPIVQLSNPTDLSLITGTSSVTLSWTAVAAIPNIGCRVPGSNAPDLVYRLYYDTDTACAPYDGQGLLQGSSPINVGQSTAITLSGFSPQSYFFVVTARDYLGRESSYSNVVMKPSRLQVVYLPLIRK